jgi:branched-chain amino acid transport system permease protein
MLPSGTFPEKYEQDKAIIRTRLQWGLFLGFLVLLAFVPVLVSDATLGMLSLMGIFMVVVLGLQILVGYCGQINLGQSSFMGVGGLMGCLAAMRLNLPVEAALIIGGLAGAVYGLIFAIPAIRVKGFYLALTTMAAQLIFHFIFTRVPKEFFLGTYGGFPVASPTLLTGMQLTSPGSMYYLVLVVVAVSVFVATNITRSRLGRAFMAIRDNEVAAQVMGINIVLYKFLAFVICAFFAGVAGVLWGYYMRFVGVDQFTLVQSVFMLGMLIVGGLGSILGAILGTAFLRTLQEIVNAVGPSLAMAIPQLGAGIIFALMNVMVGLVIILFLVFEPRGLAHRWRILQRFYRLWPFPY